MHKAANHFLKRLKEVLRENWAMFLVPQDVCVCISMCVCRHYTFPTSTVKAMSLLFVASRDIGKHQMNIFHANQVCNLWFVYYFTSAIYTLAVLEGTLQLHVASYIDVHSDPIRLSRK